MNETRDLCLKIRDELYKKYLREPPPEFFDTVANVINGMWCVDPFLNVEAILVLTYRTCDLKCKYRKKYRYYFDKTMCLYPEYPEKKHSLCIRTNSISGYI